MIYACKKIKGIKYTLTQKQPHSYDGFTTAKNSGQNWRSEFTKMRGRILYGFFYVCKIFRVMTVCREELSGSPRFFVSGTPILYSLSPFQLALKVTVSKFTKETAPCL